jgi:hypothetical protein
MAISEDFDPVFSRGEIPHAQGKTYTIWRLYMYMQPWYRKPWLYTAHGARVIIAKIKDFLHRQRLKREGK